jgi:hypothetical protein
MIRYLTAPAACLLLLVPAAPALADYDDWYKNARKRQREYQKRQREYWEKQREYERDQRERYEDYLEDLRDRREDYYEDLRDRYEDQRRDRSRWERRYFPQGYAPGYSQGQFSYGQPSYPRYGSYPPFGYGAYPQFGTSPRYGSSYYGQPSFGFQFGRPGGLWFEYRPSVTPWNGYGGYAVPFGRFRGDDDDDD